MFRLVATAAVILTAAAPAPQVNAETPFLGHGGPVRAIALDPSGELLASGGFDYSVVLWDSGSGEVLGEHYGHNASVNVVAFAGNAIWSGDQAGSLLRWDGHGEPETLLDLGAAIASLSVVPDGEALLVGAFDGSVLWLDATGLVLARRDHPQVPTALAAIDGDTALLGDRAGSLWELARRDDGTFDTLPLRAASGFGLTALAVWGDRVAATTLGGNVRLFDRASGTLLAEREAERTPLLAATVSDDGAWLVTAGGEGFVQLWDRELIPVRSWQAHEKTTWSVVLDSASRLFTAGSDGAIRLWETGSGRLEMGEPIVAATAADADLATTADRGEALFRTCAACHTLVDDNSRRAGPTLAGVFGRRAGTVPGYPYSPALADSDIIWDETTIDALFRDGPHIYTPGSKMPLQQMHDADDRRALIAYLKRATAPLGD